MRRLSAFLAVVLIFGCGNANTGKLRKEIGELRKAKAEAEAENVAFRKEIAAYRADLEHKRFLNQELKRKIKGLNDIRRIADIADRLPKLDAKEKKKALPKPEQASGSESSPISAAIAVATTVPVAEPIERVGVSKPTVPKPQPAAQAKKQETKSTPQVKKQPPKPAPQPRKRKAPALAQKKEKHKVRKPPARAESNRIDRATAVAAIPLPRHSKGVVEGKLAADVKRPEEIRREETGPQAASALDSQRTKELQLLNLVNRKQGEKLELSGEVRNNTSLPVEKVIVTVWLYDDRNAIVKEMRIPVLGGSSLPGGQKAAFQAELPWDSRISRCGFEVEGVQKVSVSRRD